MHKKNELKGVGRSVIAIFFGVLYDKESEQERMSVMETVTLNEQERAMVIIDQTKLPGSVEMLHLTKQNEIWDAIKELKVRGAPAIGVAAAIGIYLAALEIDTDDIEVFESAFQKAKAYLASSRPTAVNLFWALDRMERRMHEAGGSVADRKETLRQEAWLIKNEDTQICKDIGEHALTLLEPGMGILTHCNAGALATTKYGTATSAMYLGQERGYDFHVYCDETRPLLQGARLTSYELSSAGIDTTLLCDNMAASLMRTGKIQAVMVGCDRVAANGDVCNKIGTSYVALAAKEYGIPFYVCCPISTIDFNCPDGEHITIEQRDPNEVTEMWYKERMAPENIKVYNPAFDVTDHSLVTAIITEKGVMKPPYLESFTLL